MNPFVLLMIWTCLLLNLTFSNTSHALGELKFGPEFSLSDLEQDGSTGKFDAVVKRMREHLVDEQPDAEKFHVNEVSKHFVSPNGWWFDCFFEGYDAGSTIEVRMSPVSVEYFKQFKGDMQDAIFASAANKGIFPALFRGGGHINISASAFDSELLLRNFIVDTMINHNELFMGVFGYDTNNAMSYWMLAERTQDQVMDLIRQFDEGHFDAKDFIEKLNTILMEAQDQFVQQWRGHQSRSKFHAVNFNHFVYGHRLEIRAVRPQASMDVWVRQIELLEARLRYLDKIPYRIPIAKKVPMHGVKIEKHLLQPPIDPQWALRAFYEYVTESGLKWKDHTDYLWPKWILDHEVEIFEGTRWFKDQEAKRNCESHLEPFQAVAS